VSCMTHACRMCGALTFDNRPHGPIRCKDCGNVGMGTIDTWDEEPDDPDRDEDPIDDHDQDDDDNEGGEDDAAND
jgi:hypothetical protein